MKKNSVSMIDAEGNETELPLVIKVDESKNVINVYYTKDEFESYMSGVEESYVGSYRR